MNTDKKSAAYLIGADAVIEEVDDLDARNITYQGESLTEARLAELNEIAEREAVARRNAGLVPGGKSLSGGGRHSPVVQVRVSESPRDKLKAIADSRRISVSKLSRQVLDDYVNTHSPHR